MNTLLLRTGLVFAMLFGIPPIVWAAHTETIIGAAIGGGAGAAIGRNMGGRDNAIIWSAIGGATGAAVGSSIGERHHDVVRVRERPVYYEDVEVHHYYPQPQRVYYAPSESYRDYDEHHYIQHRRYNRHHRHHHDDDDDDDD